jgi:hypothetical protein
MHFKVVNEFKDTKDKNTIYKVGEVYPKTEHKPSEKRIKELSGVHPKYKRVFIEKIEEKQSEPQKGKEKEQQGEEDKPSNQLTEAELKKLNKEPQEELIKQLGGNPEEAKNEAERIALILSLQEKKNADNNEPSPE